MFCYRDYQLTTRFNQQNEKSTSNQQGKSCDHHWIVAAETKMHGSWPCNCKYIKGLTDQSKKLSTRSMEKGKNAILAKKTGATERPKARSATRPTILWKKEATLPQRPYPSSQEASKSTIKLEANWPKHLYEMWWHSSQTRISLSCQPLSM